MDNNRRIATHDFGVKDDKGRQIGARVETYDANKLSADGTTSIPIWCFQPWAMRGGKVFGAVQYPREFANVVERDEAVKKYLDGARKRAEKLARAKYGAAAPTVRV